MNLKSTIGAVLIILLFSGLILLFPPYITYVLLSFLMFAIAFFINPKTIIYLLIFIFPLIPILSKYTAMQTQEAYLSINIGGFINLGLVLLTVLYLFLKKDETLRYRLLIPIIALLGILGMSILYTPLKLFGIRQWFRYAMPAMCYFIVLNSFRNLKQINKLLKFTLLFSFILPFIFGLWQLVVADNIFIVSGLNRIYGTLLHPNRYAMFLVVFLLLATYHIFEYRPKYRWLYFALFIGMAVSLFYTFTRIGWASFLVAISVLVFLRYRKFYLLIPLFATLAVIVLPYFKDTLLLRLQPDASFWQRFDLNNFGLFLFKQRPIFGHGIGSYPLLSHSTFGTIISQRYGVTEGLSAHNDYIKYLAEGGVLGLLIFLFFILSALKLAIQVFKFPHSTTKNYGAFLIALIGAVVVFGITDHSLEYVGFYLFIFLAIGEAILQRMRLLVYENSTSK